MNKLEKKLFGFINEDDIVKNKKTGNVYMVKTFDPAKHDKPTPDEVEKTKAANGGKIPTSENIYNAVVGFVEKKPTKKVYISRKYMESSYPDIELTEASTRNTDRHKRIDNEEEIENFFKSYNFEILYPENSFDSLEQQIDYFKDVKTLVGLTGAGLTNSVFMQPETNLVEIASPIIFYNRIYSTSIVDFSEAQHFFYSKIAFERKLFYYTVNNIEKKSNIVIERIKHNKGILDLLNE